MTAPSAKPARDAVHLLIVGDLHDQWNDYDLEFLNVAPHDAVVFVGDLGRGETTSRRIARSIARIEKPTLVMPGNADAPHGASLNVEFSRSRGLDRLFGAGSDAAAAPDFGGVRLCGYSLHRPQLSPFDFTIVAGRPYSLGGPELSFGSQLHGEHGVGSLDDSAKLLVDLVDRAETEALVFVSHNGPSGLGEGPTDPWGADFLPEPADWGDPDLSVAIAHAEQTGRRVLAVVAGHMHLEPRKRGVEREWRRHRDGVLYINPARMPRITSTDGLETHHFVELIVSERGAQAAEIFAQRPPA